jgi:transcriptional regulator with XRE-family HTH domain
MATKTETFGATLRRLRETAELSRRALEDQSGLSQRQIKKLEDGETTNPTIETVLALADALGPAILEAAFRGRVVALPEPGKHATARYLGQPFWPMRDEPSALVAAAT